MTKYLVYISNCAKFKLLQPNHFGVYSKPCKVITGVYFLWLLAEFLKAKCLMNCEVSLILEHKYEQLQQMSEDPTNQVSQ